MSERTMLKQKEMEGRVLKRHGNHAAFVSNKINGDGSCYLHCFLDHMSSSYKELGYREKSLFANKLRLDFANTLLADSKRSFEYITKRCNLLITEAFINFFNPEVVIGTEIKRTRDVILSILEEFKDDGDEEALDLLIARIASLDLYWTNNYLDNETEYRQGEKLTYEEIIAIYERDYRLNQFYSDTIVHNDGVRNNVASPVRKESYGIGVIPLTIFFFEIVRIPPNNYEVFMETIGILISDRSILPHYRDDLIRFPGEFIYLEDAQSDIFAKMMGINVVAIVKGAGYDKERYFGNNGFLPEYPTILLLNLNCVHWELISFIRILNGKESNLKLLKNIKTSLFTELQGIVNNQIN